MRGRSRRSAPSRPRSPTWSGRSATRRCTQGRRPHLRRSPRGRTSSSMSCPREAAETILEHLETATAAMAAVQLRVLGGAMARVPDDATAFGHRGAKLMVNIAAMYQRAEERPEHETWASRPGEGALRWRHAAGLRRVRRRRGRGRRPPRVPARDPRAPRPGEASVRPGQPLSPQPERAGGGDEVIRTYRRRATTRCEGGHHEVPAPELSGPLAWRSSSGSPRTSGRRSSTSTSRSGSCPASSAASSCSRSRPRRPCASRTARRCSRTVRSSTRRSTWAATS